MDLAVFGALVILVAVTLAYVLKQQEQPSGCCGCQKDNHVHLHIDSDSTISSGHSSPGKSSKAAKAAKAAEVPIDAGRKSKSWIDKEPTDSNIKSKK